MIGLARFVMRGRLQALVLAVGGASSLLFCWISAAVVALVTLRKGAAEGAWLLFWALLPASIMLYMVDDSGPLTVLVGTFTLALVLRATVSLPMAILASVLVGVVTGLLLVAFGSAYLEQLATAFGEFLARMETQLSAGGEQIVLPRPETGQIAGLLGGGGATLAVLCLLLARYWQAALFNPGGFGQEFRALHYPVSVTLLLVAMAVILSSTGATYRSWAMMCLLPLSFAGLSLVHARIEMRGGGPGWLVSFYLIWLVFDPVKLLVVCAAIADSWFNFRQRWAPQGGPLSPPGDGAAEDSEESRRRNTPGEQDSDDPKDR